MPKKSTNTQPAESLPFIVTHAPLVLAMTAVVIFAVFSGLWWTKVYSSPRRVFDGMLRNNLATSSVTRSTETIDDASFKKDEQLSFVPPVAVRSLVSIDQSTESGSNKVLSETIGTATTDYSQYRSIVTSEKNAAGKARNYAPVLNTWGKSEAGAEPQYLAQSLMGLVPFGNLQNDDRAQMIDRFNELKAYEVNYATVKPKKVGSKSALSYTVNVNPFAYITFLKELGPKIGTKGFESLDAEQYKGQAAIVVTMVVDKQTRQLLEVQYGQQKETYASYGLKTAIAIPEKTIPVGDLQQKVQEIQ